MSLKDFENDIQKGSANPTDFDLTDMTTTESLVGRMLALSGGTKLCGPVTV